MVNKIIFITFILISFIIPCNSLNYITTAESISWSGAYTSVADGFEAMLYNPAGIYMSKYRYGLNMLGSYGFRAYSNSITTDHVLKILAATEQSKNLSSTGILSEILLYMPEFGADFGADISAFNFMTYMKFSDFSLGVSLIPKTSLTFTADKGIFKAVFEELDLVNPVDYTSSTYFMQYLDLNISLSTRAKFLERIMPIQKIYVGISGHLYFPTLYYNSSSKVSLTNGNPNSQGIIDNYLLSSDTTAYGSANIPLIYAMNAISGYVNSYGQQSENQMLSTAGNLMNSSLNAISSYGNTFAFGLGFDLGFIAQFNRYAKLGLAITDIGFIVFPRTSRMDIDYSLSLDLKSSDEFRDSFFNGLIEEYEDSDNVSEGGAKVFMPNTCFRIGIAVTPFKKDIFIWATDVSLSDLNRMINGGYPTFNFSTGIEFKPSYMWFAMPLRTAFSYNSQANTPSFSLGIGLYLGPVEMEIAVKGLEFLIADLGAKEFCAGADLKFEF